MSDDINTKIAAVDGGEFEDFGKPLFGGLIVPFGDPERRAGQRVGRVGDKRDCVGVSKNRIGWPSIGIGPSRVCADE